MKRFYASLLGIAACLTGCSSANVEDYASNTPKLDIREYFNGPVEASGVFLNWYGAAETYFHVTMNGEWKGNDGTLTEDFIYSNGKKDHRVWTLKVLDDNNFTGAAHDVIGIAQGKQYGNAVNMRYVLRVPTDGTTYDLSMNDWLYRVDEKTLINKIVMRKFGIKVGELVISFKKK